MKNKQIVLLYLIIYSLTSCSISSPEFPYIHSKPIMSLEKNPENYLIAGIIFEYINKTDKTVEEINLMFTCSDSSGKTIPLSKGNPVFARSKQKVYPFCKTTFVISLDQVIKTIPTEEWILEPFIITQILYSDGSKWEDPSVLQLNWNFL